MVVRVPPETDDMMHEEQSADDTKKGRKKSKSSQQYSCQVNCLDGSIIKAEVERHAQGEELYNKVISDLSITEKECVGLNFTNEKGIKLWLDIHKEMKHQIGDNSDVLLNFRLKFYEPEPSRIKDVFLRYLFYLQLREDLIEGRLKCNENTYAILGSYTVQAELGDFNLHTHDHDYLRDYMFAPEQTSDLIKSVHDLHKEHRGQSPSQAEINFLEVAKKIPRYGVDVHKAKDSEGDIEIGVAAIGLYVYRYDRKEYLFRWQVVDAVLYNRRKYTVKIKEAVPKVGEKPADEDDTKAKKKPQLTFIYYFDSATKCKQCYKASVEYHTFFRLARPDTPRKKADSLKIGSSFRYSDRTLYQLRHRPVSDEDPATDVPFTRTPSKIRSTNTPRESWNPDEEHLKDRDAGILENGTGLPLVDEEPQYEEIEIDETSPDNDKFDPKEWEVIERELPDGTVKRYRRRVIHVVLLKGKKPDGSPVEETPLNQEYAVPDKKHRIVEDIPIVVGSAVDVESEPILDIEEPWRKLEEVEIDEANPEDSWYDPSEWDVVERTMPDGTKKRYRVRLVEAYGPIDPDLAVDTGELEAVPKDYRCQCLVPCALCLKPVLTTPSNLLVDEPVMQMKEVDIDEAHPEVFDPNEWQVTEVLKPDGSTKKVRRTILVTHVSVIPKKPSEISADVPMGILEEVDVEEIPLDEAHPEDLKYDPNEWEVAEKILPDGKKQVVRRRVLVTKLQFVNKKPCDVPSDEPLAIIEEVEIDPANPEPFDSNEWEVTEKELPDGTSKPVRRRVLINNIQFINRKPSEVGSNESVVAIEEVDVDKESPEDSKYDPSEWEVVEKTLPNGEIIPVRRRVVITRYQVVNKKPSEVDPNEPLTEVEEVEIGDDQPDNEKYASDEWEVEEVVQPDGTSKYVCRRVIITRVEYVYKKPSDVTIDEQPVAELEEVEVDEENPDDDKYDPNEWEITGKTMPDGKQIRVRRRYVIRRVHINYKKPSDVPPDDRQLKVEEIEIDEENPEDEKYDPNQWEIVEKTSPGCMGKVKRVRRRIVETRVSIQHITPSEISDDDPLKEAIKDDGVDPQEWEDAKIVLANGDMEPGRHRYLVPQVSTEYIKPSEIPSTHPIAEVEEVEISPVCIEDQKLDPDEWELTEKVLPDGTRKPVHRRYKVQNYVTEYKKPCDVESEIPIAVIEEVEIEPSHIEDDKLELDGWETCEKVLPDGTTKKVRRRYIVTSKQKTYKRPDELADDVPHLEVEESLIDEDKPEDDKYDPTEWDVVEKVTPYGENKRYRCRIKVTKLAKMSYKPSDVTPNDADAQVEEVDMDGQLPENFDPAEWDIIEKPLPDGTTKRVRRRFIVTRVEVVLKKPSELTDDEPLGISVEEVPLSEAEKANEHYDPSEWEVVEKPCPDGTKQRVIRRIVVKIRSPKKSEDRHPVPIVEELMVIPEVVALDESYADTLLPDSTPSDKRGSKKILRRRSIKTKITPVGGRSVSVSTEEVPKQTEEIEIDESDPQDEKYDSKEWETIEKVMPDGTIKRFRHRIVETVITTVNKKYDDTTMTDGAPVCMEEFEIDDAHPENVNLDPSECEILEKTLPDGSSKRYSRRIIASALPDSTRDNDTPELWEEVEIDESHPEDEKFDSNEWEVFEKTLPDGSKKRFRRRNLNVVTVHKKPIAITAGDVPLRVQDIEVDEDLDQDINLDDWEVVEKTLPDGRKKKFHRKILTTIFSSLNEKNEMIENPPIHIEEVEIYEVSSDDEDSFSPTEWDVVDKVLPDGRITKVRSRSSVTVITPKNTMKLEDKSVEETPVVAEEIELDESAPHEHLDPEEWDIIERKLPDGTTKRFHRRIIRKYKKVPSQEQLVDEPTLVEVRHPVDLEECPVEEFELDGSDPEELQKYNTPEWEIVERVMPDGKVKHFRRKIITTVITTVTTKTIVVHPDGREEVIDIETTPGKETTLESIDGDLETVTENFMKNLHPEEEPQIQPLLEDNLETGVDMTFDVDNILSEIDQISKSFNDDDKTRTQYPKKPLRQHQKEDKLKGKDEEYMSGLSEEELKRIREEEEKCLEDHNATISSIFSIDDDEYHPPRSTRDHDCRECDETISPADVVEETFEFASADVDFGTPTEEEIVRTASVLKQKKLPKNERRSSAEEEQKVLSLDRRYLKRGETAPIRPHSAIPRVGSPDDNETLPRSFSNEQGDVFQPHSDAHSEILYTLRDVSEVEQGHGGFVQAIKERHDKMANEELQDILHDAEYPDRCVLPPKGHVPTHSVSYTDVKEPDITLTKDPPSVTGLPTVIVPASSELPDEEVVFQISNSHVESHPDLLSEITNVVIPEVKTQSVIFEEKTDDGVSLVQDPGVETRSVQIVPVTESYTMQHDMTHTPTMSESVDPNNRCQVTTYTMPTEVITKTITCEGDPSTMTREELQEIIRRAGSNEDFLDDESSTHVVTTTTVQKVITGETTTVVGDDEAELQKAINEAVKNASTECEEMDDGTVVLTVVQQYDEDGNMINTEVVEETDTIENDGTEI